MEILKFPLALTSFIVAATFSLVATSPVIRASARVGALDVPRDDRRMHTRAVPRAGGIAIFTAFALALCFYCRGEFSPIVASALTGGAIMTALGLCDDVSPLPPKVKLAGECCVALIPLAFGAFPEGIELFGKYFPLPTAICVALSFLWIITVTNALNLIDGLDGLASGVSFVVAAAILLRNLLFSHNAECVAVCASLAGALFGFLPYNAKNAKIFMGDCGSLSLGYILSLLALVGTGRSSVSPLAVSPLAALLLLGYPLADTTLAVIRRAKAGTGIFTADKSHIHHRLCRSGLACAEAVLTLLCATALLCCISMAL